MAAAPPPLLLVLVLLLHLPAPSLSAALDPLDDVPYNTSMAETAHDKLAEHGLPKWLLPSPVASFSHDPSTGLLLVRLPTPDCLVHPLRFSGEIRGRLSRGRLSAISGIRARFLFFWLPLTSVLSHPSRPLLTLRSGPLALSLPLPASRPIPRCAGLRPPRASLDLPCRGDSSPPHDQD